MSIASHAKKAWLRETVIFKTFQVLRFQHYNIVMLASKVFYSDKWKQQETL